MRISDWSSDVCSSDLWDHQPISAVALKPPPRRRHRPRVDIAELSPLVCAIREYDRSNILSLKINRLAFAFASRSEEHTSELQSLMRISYAVFCLKNKKK